ncbi:MAG: DUF424 family protein [Candidatus Pacearchaeota archaeon]
MGKEKKFLVKIHKTYREIVAVSDVGLLGKRFEQDNLQLEINEHFYGGEDSKVVNEKILLRILKKAKENDACFNFVGKNSINVAIKSGLVDERSIIKIQGIPHALCLL